MSFDIPLRPAAKFPERLTIPVSEETKKRIEDLKRKSGVDTPELLRRAVDEAIEKAEKQTA